MIKFTPNSIGSTIKILKQQSKQQQQQQQQHQCLFVVLRTITTTTTNIQRDIQKQQQQHYKEQHVIQHRNHQQQQKWHYYHHQQQRHYHVSIVPSMSRTTGSITTKATNTYITTSTSSSSNMTGKMLVYPNNPNIPIVTIHNRHSVINNSQNKIIKTLSYSYFVPIVHNTLFNNNFSYRYRYYSNTNSTHYSASINQYNNTNSSIKSNSITNDIPYILADIGEGIKEVEIIEWYVNVNDTIQQFDKVCLVQSDKATVEITSRYDGIISSLLNKKVGDVIQVGQPLLYLYNNTTTTSNSNSTTSTGSKTNINTSSTPKVVESKMTLPEKPIEDNSQTQSSMTTNGKETDSQTNSSAINFMCNDHEEQVLVANTNDNNDTKDQSLEKQYYFPSISKKFEASPAVRKLVKQYGLLNNNNPDTVNDSSYNDDNTFLSIQGTGPKGRILKHDVEKHLQERGIQIKKPYSNQQQHHEEEVLTINTDNNTTKSSENGNNATIDATTNNNNNNNNDTIITLKGYNRLMYKTMSRSVSIPTMGFADEIIMNELQTFRTSMNQQYLDNKNNTNTNIKISILAILIKICSISLKEYPIINSIIHNDSKMELKICTSHNIGIAMQTQRGLVVPVLHNCQLLSIVEIQEQLNYYKECGKTFSFTTDELSNPTFIISNIGSIHAGGTYMKPIIVHPTIIIGALGMIQPPVPRYKNPILSTCTSTIYPASIMPISWSADHRYLDGATLAQFSFSIKQYIEHPYRLLSKLK